MFGLGTTELLVIGGILILIFGAKRLPEIGKGLGGAIREFKNISRSTTESVPPAGNSDKSGEAVNGDPLMVEETIKEKLVDQIPGAKKVLQAKKKAEMIKDVIDS